MSLVKLATSKKKMLEAIRWMSAADDFSIDGKARKGFNKLVKPILEKNAVASELVQNNTDPRLLPTTERQKPQLRVKPNKTVLNWGMKK
jgi:hypothetical protein